MRQPLPIGTSDFIQLRRDGQRYIDKTGFIVEVMRASSRIILLPRPRRFGKTLALTTLAAYLERTAPDSAERVERTRLFEDLAVWRAGDDIRGHFGRYPVLMLSFKDVKEASWAGCRAGVARLIGELCERCEPALSGALSQTESRALTALIDATSDDVTLSSSLLLLSRALHRATGEPCIILIDEYDSPLHAALEHGYYEDAIGLFRNLLSGAFKDNAHLHKGVLTGILHITKESIFSGLNNLAVYTLLSSKFSQHFGFTPEEVALLAEEYGLKAHLPEIERWYNGYNFGGQTLYNPWSVLRYLNEPEMGARPYWINTASNALLRELLVDRAVVGHAELETLLTGGSISELIDEHVVLHNLHRRADAVWGLLLFSGYLKAVTTTRERAKVRATLAVPNEEVHVALMVLFEDFLVDSLGDARRVRELCAALLRGDGDTFGRLLGELLAVTLSYHDVARPRTGRKGEPRRAHETVYHAFLLGLLATLEASHHVRSNREAGYGRYDVMLLPRRPGEPGAVLELKVIAGDETAETALASAMAQLKDRDYAAELREQGAEPVVAVAAVFDGKRVWVRVDGG